MSSETYALVTGASAGIGQAIAEELASRHINVLLVALPGTGLPKVAQHITQSYPVKAEWFEIDLTLPKATKRVITWCRYNEYRVNILVNNAGFGNLRSFEITDAGLLEKMMFLNNQALVMLTHQFIPELRKNAEAYILNVGSLASFLPLPNKSVYAATKSFVYAFSSSLRLELLSQNISVSCLCPGGTRTNKGNLERIQKIGLLGNIFSQSAEEVAEEAVAGMLKRKHRIIPGFHNRVLYNLSRVLPESLIYFIVQQLFNRKSTEQEQNRIPASANFTLGLILR